MVRFLEFYLLISYSAFAGDESTVHTHIVTLKGKYDPKVLIMAIIALVILIGFLWLAPLSTKKKNNKNKYFKTKRKRGKSMKLPF